MRLSVAFFFKRDYQRAFASDVGTSHSFCRIGPTNRQTRKIGSMVFHQKSAARSYKVFPGGAMRFLIAEDHELVATTLIELLKHTFGKPVVAWVRTSGELLKAFGDSGWDVLLLDIELADTTSLDFIPELKEIRPNCRILVYSGHPEKVFGMQAMKAGADGFIHKCSASGEFMNAIKAVAKGEKYVSHQVAMGLIEVYQGSVGMAKEVTLSPRESQVMQAIASGKFNNEIAGELKVSEKTVSTYRTRVLGKLDLRNNADLVKRALRMGYVK